MMQREYMAFAVRKTKMLILKLTAYGLTKGGLVTTFMVGSERELIEKIPSSLPVSTSYLIFWSTTKTSKPRLTRLTQAV